MRSYQVGDILRLLDARKVWSLRNKYAALRPTGWRSDPTTIVPAKCGPNPCSLVQHWALTINVNLVTHQADASYGLLAGVAVM